MIPLLCFVCSPTAFLHLFRRKNSLQKVVMRGEGEGRRKIKRGWYLDIYKS